MGAPSTAIRLAGSDLKASITTKPSEVIELSATND
jgi:hypothetical protein